MAEPVGLALGTIALASLFSTCIELVEYFELGRSFAYDYQLACLKLSLLKSRLDYWGEILKVRDAGHEKEELRVHWLEEQEVITRSLLGIKEIFGNAELLADKYKLLPRQSRSLARSFLAGSEHETCAHTAHPHTRKNRRFFIIRRTTTWAIRDKQKFDGLLLDLDFFISSLETVIARISMSENQQRISKKPAPVVQQSSSDSRNRTTTVEKSSRTKVVTREREVHDDEAKRTQSEPRSSSQKSRFSAPTDTHEFHFRSIEDKARAAFGAFGGASAPDMQTVQKMMYTVEVVKDDAKVKAGTFTIASEEAFFK
jgi:hypothetical protein